MNRESSVLLCYKIQEEKLYRETRLLEELIKVLTEYLARISLDTKES